MDDTNANNGLLTKIWGPPLWVSLHCISFGYPVKPTEEKKKEYKDFFTNVKNILPCKYCRESYESFITTEPTILNDNALENRKTLTKWLYDIHNRVNNKLGVDYGVTYEDVVKRYESYRAKCSKPKSDDKEIKGCIMPLYEKDKAFIKANIKDCPIIDIPDKKLKYLISYAKIRGIDKNIINNSILVKKINSYENSNKWNERNKYCDNLIKNMREKGIESIEQKGRWINLPTKNELLLMLNKSSNLNKDELIKIYENLENKFKYKKYKLIS